MFYLFGEAISNIDTIDVLSKTSLDIMDKREPTNPARTHCLHFNGAVRNYGSFLCTKAVSK